MTTREALREMIDDIPDSLLGIAGDSLDRLRNWRRDPLLRSLAEAPIDDEPTMAEDIAAIEAGRKSMREGRGLTDEELDALLARHPHP
ncbi:MAG: hypothetical protein ACRDHF_16075 [Tepidiformaceae bacterium]